MDGLLRSIVCFCIWFTLVFGFEKFFGWWSDANLEWRTTKKNDAIISCDPIGDYWTSFCDVSMLVGSRIFPMDFDQFWGSVKHLKSYTPFIWGPIRTYWWRLQVRSFLWSLSLKFGRIGTFWEGITLCEKKPKMTKNDPRFGNFELDPTNGHIITRSPLECQSTNT